MLKIGILTSGGDCQALNAAMRGIVLSLYEKYNGNIEIYGFLEGYKGLIGGRYKRMKKSDFEDIINLGGTILGTSRQPFKKMNEPDENGLDKVKAMVTNYKALKLDCLTILGGNGTHKTAYLLQQKGLKIVTLPKTIDNDIYGTNVSFGFQSAVDIATKNIEYIRTTAKSHGRVFIVELMGNKSGWLTLYAGIAGNADVIIIPEIPYNIEKIAKKIKDNKQKGKNYSIIVVAEGIISQAESELYKKEIKRKRENENCSAGYRLAEELKEMSEQEIRVMVTGHIQRGGNPCAYDKVLATCMGAKAAELIAEQKYGYMVGMLDDHIMKVPISEVAGKKKLVDLNNDIIKHAKMLGICFGDE